MKKQKIILVAVLAMALVMLMACGLLSKVESIEFTKAPAASYELNKKVEAKDFTVKISFVGGNPAPQIIALTDSRLTVEGLVDGRLDTATVGRKTLKVTYQGVSITIYYNVTGDAETKTWADADATSDGKKLYERINAGGVIDLDKDYDLSAYQWKSVDVNEPLTINGNGHTIKGMTITSKNAVSFDTDKKNSAAGFLGFVNADVTVTNLKFEDPTINYLYNTVPQNKEEELSKNYGVVIGIIGVATVKVEKVEVTNAYLRGMGRVAGIVGSTSSTTKGLEVQECVVRGTFVGYNPVTESSGDGEADKLAGILGQHQGGTLTINLCRVKVVINGTRDLGGIVGFISSTAANITNNQVEEGSVIGATVLGGMDFETKGTRNVGGVVGTLQNGNINYTITGNTFKGVVSGNSAYNETSTGNYVGGFRRLKTTTKFKVNNTEYEVRMDPTNYFNDVKTQIEKLNKDLAAVNHGA